MEVRLEWGRRGTEGAAARGDLIVVVDVLSFSTTVATAVHAGAVVYPCASRDEAAELAREVGAAVAAGREEAAETGGFSLSPQSVLGISAGTRLVLPSPNGATCSRYGARVPYLFAGALVNARAVGEAVERVRQGNDLGVTVLACGERWETPHEDGPLRFAMEDYLGAGAILCRLRGEKSAEATLCELAFRAAGPDLEALLLACDSGRELRERGYEGDVRHAAVPDRYDTVPLLQDGAFVRWR